MRDAVVVSENKKGENGYQILNEMMNEILNWDNE